MLGLREIVGGLERGWIADERILCFKLKAPLRREALDMYFSAKLAALQTWDSGEPVRIIIDVSEIRFSLRLILGAMALSKHYPRGLRGQIALVFSNSWLSLPLVAAARVVVFSARTHVEARAYYSFDEAQAALEDLR